VLEEIEFGVRATIGAMTATGRKACPISTGSSRSSIFDDAARQNALISGEVDYIDTADLNTVALLERAPGINMLSITGTQHYGLPMDTRAAPFSDNNVGWR
jgi:peptide/nickel transport system substrate-binding protein